jgi:phosphoglycolate phosphatase-like HAD superfamily hydrolase
MTTLYLDLDGTLIDVSDRYYRIYKEVVLSIEGNPLEKSEYWGLRRQGVPESKLFSQLRPFKESSDLLVLRSKKLEAAEYLKYDQLVPGALETLNFLKARAQLVLVTLRKAVTELRQQLQTLGLSSFFDQVLYPNQRVDDHATSKAALISQNPWFKIKGSLIVGDSEADILAGRLLSIKSIAVLSGIREREVLVRYEPDYIIDSLAGLPALFGAISANDFSSEIDVV